MDDPCKEHAKSYPDCTFLNLMKTPEYVRRVKGLSHSIFQYSYLPSTNNIDPVKDEYVFNVNNELDIKKSQGLKSQITCLNYYHGRALNCCKKIVDLKKNVCVRFAWIEK